MISQQKPQFTFNDVMRICEGYKINCNGRIISGNPMRYNTPISLAEIPMINDCIDWFTKNATPRKKMNHNYGSYYLKHVIERDCGRYICNGACIVAGIICGYRCGLWYGPNCCFNIKINKGAIYRGY